MLYGFLATLFVVMCIFLILLILIQRGKGSSGIGSIGSGAQTLFGGSGGQDIFQKITWTLGVIFMAGSIILGYLKHRSSQQSRYIKAVQTQSNPAETLSENPIKEATHEEKVVDTQDTQV